MELTPDQKLARIALAALLPRFDGMGSLADQFQRYVKQTKSEDAFPINAVGQRTIDAFLRMAKGECVSSPTARTKCELLADSILMLQQFQMRQYLEEAMPAELAERLEQVNAIFLSESAKPVPDAPQDGIDLIVSKIHTRWEQRYGAPLTYEKKHTIRESEMGSKARSNIEPFIYVSFEKLVDNVNSAILSDDEKQHAWINVGVAFPKNYSEDKAADLLDAVQAVFKLDPLKGAWVEMQETQLTSPEGQQDKYNYYYSAIDCIKYSGGENQMDTTKQLSEARQRVEALAARGLRGGAMAKIALDAIAQALGKNIIPPNTQPASEMIR